MLLPLGSNMRWVGEGGWGWGGVGGGGVDGGVGGGCMFKNAYELLNLRALKISTV